MTVLGRAADRPSQVWMPRGHHASLALLRPPAVALVAIVLAACGQSTSNPMPSSNLEVRPSAAPTVTRTPTATPVRNPSPTPTASSVASTCNLGLSGDAVPGATSDEAILETLADLAAAAEGTTDDGLRDYLTSEVELLTNYGLVERCRRHFTIEGARRPTMSRVLVFGDIAGASAYVDAMDRGCAQRELDLDEEARLTACSFADIVIGLAIRRDGPIVREVSTTVQTDPSRSDAELLDDVAHAADLLASMPPID